MLTKQQFQAYMTEVAGEWTNARNIAAVLKPFDIRASELFDAIADAEDAAIAYAKSRVEAGK